MFRLIKVKWFQFKHIFFLIKMKNKSKEAFLCSWICSDCAMISQNRGRYSERWYEPNSELLSKFSHPTQWSWDFQTSAEAKWTALDGWVVKGKLKERSSLLMQLCATISVPIFVLTFGPTSFCAYTGSHYMIYVWIDGISVKRKNPCPQTFRRKLHNSYLAEFDLTSWEKNLFEYLELITVGYSSSHFTPTLLDN